MKFDPAILTRHLEAAAIEQVGEELQRQGYSVETGDHAEPGRTHPDLVAKRGEELVVYEIKVGGSPSRGMAQAARYARDRGAKFELIVVRPPKAVHAEVDGIERILEDALGDPLAPELAALSDRTRVNHVADVEINRVEVSGSDISVEGSG